MDHISAIQLLAECGAATSALEAEHEVLYAQLRVLNKAMEADASTDVIVRVLDLIWEYFSGHSVREEEFLRSHAIDVEPHSATHKMLNERIKAVRQSIASGKSEATLDCVDLLTVLHNHVSGDDSVAYEQVLRHSEGYGADEQHRSVELTRLARMRG